MAQPHVVVNSALGSWFSCPGTDVCRGSRGSSSINIFLMRVAGPKSGPGSFALCSGNHKLLTRFAFAVANVAAKSGACSRVGNFRAQHADEFHLCMNSFN